MIPEQLKVGPDPKREYNSFPDEAPLLGSRQIYRGGFFVNSRDNSCMCLMGHAAKLCNVNPSIPPVAGPFIDLKQALKDEIARRLHASRRRVCIYTYNDKDAPNREEIADVWNTVIVRDFDYIPE